MISKISCMIYFYHFSSVIDFSSETNIGSTGHITPGTSREDSEKK